MAFVYPGVSGGTSRLYCGHYPLKRSTTFDTGLLTFQNGYEQRWMNRGGAAGFTLAYDDLPLSDVLNLQGFIEQVGVSESLFQFNLTAGPEQEYQFAYCRFLDDAFTFTETRQNAFSATIRFQQYGTSGLVNLGQNPEFYPVLANQTLITGFPFVITDQYLIDQVDIETGVKTAWNWENKGYTDFPSRPLRRWELPLNPISNHDLALIEDHFVRCGGQYRAFTWQEPIPKNGGKSYLCRYNMDSMDITHLGYDRNATKVRLTEVFRNGWTP